MNAQELFEQIDLLEHQKSTKGKTVNDIELEYKKISIKISSLPLKEFPKLFLLLNEQIGYFGIHNLKKEPDDFSPLLAAFGETVSKFKMKFLRWLQDPALSKNPIKKVENFFKKFPEKFAKILVDEIEDDGKESSVFYFALAIIHLKAAQA